MVSIVSELELCAIERMTRQELVEAIRARANFLPFDLLEELEGQPLHRLQLLLLTGRLLQVLRHLRDRG